MTSTRPYLLRAFYEWITDNGLTPYVLVDAAYPGLEIPPGHARDNKVVLNISPSAVRELVIDNDQLRFGARFSGVAREVFVPVAAVQAIYAQENGKGMVFPDEPVEPGPEGAPPVKPAPKRPGLKIVK